MRDLIKAGCVALVLSLGLASPGAAGPLEDAAAAYNRGDYATALGLCRPMAEQGDATAQFNLAVMYDHGQGVPQDYAEAMKWYRKAADQGHALAKFNLAFMYENAQGVPQDYAEAMKWYRKAADQGNPSAQSKLGLMYSLGRGAPQDYIQAHLWFNLAATHFPATETERREKAVKGREQVAAKMTPAEIAEAQRLAREWKPK